MTTTRYILARVAQAFGYVRKNHRMSAAASETHLLREAEAYLGMAVWEKVETVESLSVEYWNLRKLVKERNEVDRRIAECKRRLDEAHEERSSLINGMPEQNEELLNERTEHLRSLEELAIRRDSVVAEAREIRRQHTGMKMKLEVLTQEHGEKAATPEHLRQIERIKEQLREIRVKFDHLKQRREEVGRAIEEGDRKLDEIDEKLKSIRQDRRLKAAEAFQVIGEMNKELSQLRAERGLLEVRMRQLFSDIGRHLSLHAYSDPKCAEAVKEQQGMVDVMRALRHSVVLNHRLAGLS